MNALNPRNPGIWLSSLLLILAAGCASTQMKPTHQQAVATTHVVETPAKQETIVLKDVQPPLPGAVSGVTMKFMNSPVEISLKNAGGSTWQSPLTPEQVALLAPSGQPETHTAKVYINSTSYAGVQLATTTKTIRVNVKPAV